MRFPTLFLLFITTLLLYIPISNCQDNNGFEDCGTLFNCGKLQNVGYPFYGEARPDNCGSPGFELKCENDDVTLIRIESVTYRVLEVNNSGAILTVARDDLWNNICPASQPDTTLDFSIFNYATGYQNITMHFGCSVIPGQMFMPLNQFCVDNESNTFAFYSITFAAFPVGSAVCDRVITVPVSLSGFSRIQNLTSSPDDLRSALARGFGLEWFANNTVCRECVETGGRCGHDTFSNSFLCFCSTGTYDRNCTGTPVETGSKKKNSSVAVGLGVAGAIIAGIGIGWLILFCRKRRKRVSAGQSALPAEAVSKDIITTPSSKPLISSSASSTFTGSIPSYPSSKSGHEPRSSYFGVQIFSYAELEEATDNFSSSRELGDGGFGAVYYGNLGDGRIVAVKRLYENNFKRQEQFINEVEILARLRHKNLVQLYGCTSKRDRELLLVYEYIPNGTVADHVHGKRAKSCLLSWPVRLKIAVETAEALAYLHKSEIIHRDVKTTNILLDNEFHVKVADFGLSRLFPNDVTHVSTAPQGTPGYVDPEYYQVYHLTEKSDVFSFGVVLIELISSLEAIDINRHRENINLANMAVNKIQNHALHELVDQSLGFETDSSVKRMASQVAELAFRCLQPMRDMRPAMQEVLEALIAIQNEELKVQKADVVEIVIDEVALLKATSEPPSPDSADKKF